MPTLPDTPGPRPPSLQDDDHAAAHSFDLGLTRRLLVFVRPYWIWVLAATVLILLTSVLDLVGPWITKLVIDRAIVPGHWQVLAPMIGWWLAVISVGLGLKSLQGWGTQVMGQTIMRDLRRQLFHHTLGLPMAVFDRTPSGRLLSRMTSDVSALNDFLTSGIVDTIADVFVLAGITAVLLWMNWRLALLVTGMVPILMRLTAWYRERARDSFRRVRTATARITGFLAEHLNGMGTVQLYGQEAATAAAFDIPGQDHWKASRDGLYYNALFNPGVEFIGSLGIAAILAYGGYETLGGALTVGELVAFLSYSTRFFQPISDLADKYNILQAAMAAAERIFALLDEPQAPDLETCLASPPPGPAAVEFRHVAFEYLPGQPVLNDLNLNIRPGEKVAFVGHTGAGKSSLINVLLRYYEVQGGQVLVDGVDIRDLPGHRRHLAVVLQDPFIFSGTVGDNIRLGAADVTPDRVREAARSVGLDDFIESLPRGYDETLHERGSNLSTGQRQLISFARALARRPRLLVLDEATASIDAGSEALIQRALSRLAGTTCLVVAHRLATVQNCDRIFVLHRGELVEEGQHLELLARRGIYHRLYTLQLEGQR